MEKIDELIRLSEILLGPNGCPWDKEQTFDSLKKYILEESHEVVQAIDVKDWENLKEELGDVLYNIIFLTKLAEKSKKFDFTDVVEGICKKIIRRHPHIFGDRKAETAEDVKKVWAEVKKEEKKSLKKQ